MTRSGPRLALPWGPCLALLIGLAADGARADATMPASTERFVLAAGANDGGHGRVQLRYAVTDAENFADVMVEMGGVPVRNRQLLVDPDRATFEAALRRLAERVHDAREARARTEVLVYYSGHADEDGLLLGPERLGYSDLRRLLDTVAADVRIAVLDACASGAITRIKGGQQRAAFLVDQSTDTRGYAFLTSSSAQESAQESDRIGALDFTYYLVSGMRGAADRSADGRVTLNEAYQFASEETLARTVDLLGGAQHPAYDMKLSGSGDLVMTDVRRVEAAVTLADDVEGRLFVRASGRRLVAELYKPPGRAVELGLTPDDYDIYLEQRDDLHVARRQLAEGERLQLAVADFEPAPRQEAVARGGPLWAGVQPPTAAAPPGRFRVELHFGGIGPEPRAQEPMKIEASAPAEDMDPTGDRFVVPDAVKQIQPWGTLSGVTLGYAPAAHWELTLAWSTLRSDVAADLTTTGPQPRTLSSVRLTSVLLGARWYPSVAARLRPFAALALGTYGSQERGLQEDGVTSWSQSRSSLGGQIGAGIDIELARGLTLGAQLGYNWMSRFAAPVGGRRDYRGAEVRLTAGWRFGG